MRIITEFRSPNRRPRKAGTAAPLIVVHATATKTVAPVLKWFMKPGGVSAHYVIDTNGDVYKLVDTRDVAYHAGKSRGPLGRGVNEYSIGIEMVNPNDGVTPYTKEQLHALGWILDVTKAPNRVKWVATHAEVCEPKGRKSDPRGLDVRAFAEKAGLAFWERPA